MRMTTIDISKILTSALSDARERIRQNLASTGTNASGRTSASLEILVDDTSGTLLGRQAFGTVEKGRKAGRVPYGFKDIIYQWMQDKGVHAERKGRLSQRDVDMTMAYHIAKKIEREGSKLYRTGGRTDIYSNVLPLTIERVRNEVSEMYLITINSILS